MSGTSCDGVDAALVRIWSRPGEQRRLEVLEHLTVPYPSDLRRALLELADHNSGHVSRLCELNFVLGQWFADAARQVLARAKVHPGQVTAVCSHGHTVWHQPRPPAGGPPSTLQFGEPAVIAERTGLTTVANFRTRDMAAGGEGAPLVPYVDWLLLRHPARHRAVQNLGGIANVTFLPAGADPEGVLAFDTGPGNMLIDAVVDAFSDGDLHYDAGGEEARSGCIHTPLLAALCEHPFLRRPPPKSTGREEFGRSYVQGLLRAYPLARPDLLATVTEFTAVSIADAYRRFLPELPAEVILGGGGVHNRFLVERLRLHLGPVRVMTHSQLGVPDDAKEAAAFALLGHETLCYRPGNLPGATGARHRVVLGQVVVP
jgi:anhydro-N-acetylmuramic acid kinase